MIAEHRIVAVLNLLRDTPDGWSVKAKAMGAGILAAPGLIPNPNPTPAQLVAAATTVDTAQGQVALRTKGAAEARDVDWVALKRVVRGSVVFVQGLCDAAPDAEHALAICKAATLDAKKEAVRVKEDFSGDAMGNGVVHLFRKVPKRGARIFYEWQMSVDGGKTWTALPTTNDSMTVVANLTPGTFVDFRSRTTIKNVTSAWSQTLNILVT